MSEEEDKEVEEVELKDIDAGGWSCSRVPTCNWPFLEYKEDVRFYYEIETMDDGKPCGFSFIAVEWVGGEHWNLETEVDILFWGWAAGDGIRHMYLNKGKWLGYWHCPDADVAIWIFQQLKKLEKENCPIK